MRSNSKHTVSELEYFIKLYLQEGVSISELQLTEQSLSSQLAQNAKNIAYVIELNRWGIKNDGTDATSTTNGINQALAWAATQYNGTCVLPRGTYLIDAAAVDAKATSGGIDIPNDMTLRLARNSILKAEANGSWVYNVIRINQKNELKIRVFTSRYLIQIPTGTKIGKGLYIAHLGSVIVNPGAILGDNINLSAGVAIGQTNRGSKKDVRQLVIEYGLE